MELKFFEALNVLILIGLLVQFILIHLVDQHSTTTFALRCYLVMQDNEGQRRGAVHVKELLLHSGGSDPTKVCVY